MLKILSDWWHNRKQREDAKQELRGYHFALDELYTSRYSVPCVDKLDNYVECAKIRGNHTPFDKGIERALRELHQRVREHTALSNAQH